ncbi:RraA family protein [Clostridium sp. MCC353]|uniref:RraA family protein n=1 Tax=Clostridium sp. MCC353 TaxID=2592646 RepID=UPI001C017C9B|nr:RraA family protein [Clostridium sp. MCC353]MBT9774916.1 RraA family protein [Clostridium sp. MCC353]
MIQWNNDDELFELMKRELYTAVIGDIMDEMGLYHQFLPPQIRPLDKRMMVAGRAMTVLEADTYGDDRDGGYNPYMSKPFGLMLEALDDLKPNEVYVCTGASPEYALVGELMAARAKTLNAAGAVVNGYIRDTRGILELDFPCFSYGSYAQDQAPRGRVINYRVPVKLGNVVIQPGDIVFGDVDGVLAIPQHVEKEVIERSYEKATGEKKVLKAIQEGMAAAESFAKYGIM